MIYNNWFIVIKSIIKIKLYRDDSINLGLEFKFDKNNSKIKLELNRNNCIDLKIYYK